jgi:hypothetical protein
MPVVLIASLIVGSGAFVGLALVLVVALTRSRHQSNPSPRKQEHP